ncbi:TrkA C-terminal domain-containing protein [Cetobacterium sp. SF1]|uniref:TrkA C-terminal domain-containing protein n=1 Tax=unclassified Cetobacterium TaxID=2630983 RepID=UPI003CF6B7B9
MDINIIILIFILFIFSYLVICEIFTILFRLTGLTEPMARFQVISMLTSCGYTTAESEVVVTSLKRRKLAFIVMLFGYVFNITIVSIVINLFLKIGEKNSFELIGKSLISIFLITIIWYFFHKTNFLKKTFDRYIQKIGTKIMFKNQDNPILILGYLKEDAIVEIYITKLPSIFKDIPLKESGIRNLHNLKLMTILRNEEDKILIDGNTILQEKDRIIIFGPLKNIKSIFVEKNKENSL